MGDHDDRRPSPVSLEDVVITGQLSLRPSRPPDYAAENRALAGLARTLAERPRDLMDGLAGLILTLCRADSAGVSILESDAGTFRWPAIAGAWARHAGGGIRVDASPCGIVIDRGSPQLFALPERHFDTALADPPTAEALTVPFRIGGRPVGTVWAVVHAPGPAFDAEDVRLLTGLSAFAAAGYQLLAALEASEAGKAELSRRAELQTGELREGESRQAFLLALSDALRPLSDPLAVQAAAMRLLAEHLQVMRASYFEVDADQDGFSVSARHERDPVPIPGHLRLSDFSPDLSAAYRAGRTLVVRDAEGEARLESQREAYRAIGVRAWAAVPLVKDGRLLAIVGVHSTTPRDWTSAEVRILEDVAERTWSAVERARAEAASRASETRLAAVFEALPLGVGVVDRDGVLVRRNREMHHYLPSGVIPSRDPAGVERWRAWKSDGTRVEPRDFPTARALRGEEILHNLEFLHTADDGGEIWTRVLAALLRGEDGEVDGAVVVVADVDAMKRSQEAARDGERRLRAVAANLPNAAVFVVDGGLHYTLAEGQALRDAGFAPSDLEGKTVAEAMGPEMAAEYEVNYRRALAGEALATEHASHGRHYATHLTPLPGPAGRPASALAVSYDITDRVRAEEEVRRARDGLEVRVAERTAELRAEIAQRRELSLRLATAQEDERRRVSRDLHDSIGQLLAGLSMALDAADAGGELPPRAAGKLAEAKQIVEALGKEAHGLAVRLRPTSLDDIGLEVALEQLVAEWSGRTGIRADFRAAGLGPGRLTPEVETTAYRVVQEALTNVARHARASLASVVVGRAAHQVTAIIEDNGRGFDPNSAPPGRLGMVGMCERVSLVGGSLEVESGPGSGTTVYVRIPLPEDGGGGP